MTDRPASPFRINLEQQRKRAKDLLKGLRAGDADAQQRFRVQHPKAVAQGAMPDDLARLSEAQLVIARELGLPSWPKLKAHVEAMDNAWDRIISGDAAVDRGMATLHIRCGSDIAPSLRQAGFAGDFLEYSDPLCQGPVLDAPDWLERRADFLAESYGEGVGRNRAQIASDLAAAEAGLRSAAERYERIILWFEHDSYDQLILARCLAQFAEAAPARLDLVSAAGYPGAMRFIGLGQLPPEALRLLWDARAPVSEDALQAGRAVWDALRAPDPRPLAGLAAAGIPALPQLGAALRRHCQELPWTGTGLSLTERLILELLAERPRTVGEAYAALMMEREPLPWLTDLMIRSIVEAMKAARAPVFTGAFAGEDRHWPQERLTMTPLGRAVLAGEVDWLSLHPPARWLGGVQIAGAPCWRWDAATASVVEC
ncbi:DUF1835 domain-containing protein [Roseomonas hellenica]|uniref:DUF1835 domain-containing protein n=1 Tax=Plastoroseomonas hellenica TaxID=2687306 RepID=A0ABS5EU67_9PROT|nr:DUF1835 domain-containing protein [Plastoroseomonas hellenica]MBR0663788.1 DUF1835 domain-containing protein [Plastoroseomonas hellenica]